MIVAVLLLLLFLPVSIYDNRENASGPSDAGHWLSSTVFSFEPKTRTGAQRTWTTHLSKTEASWRFMWSKLKGDCALAVWPIQSLILRGKLLICYMLSGFVFLSSIFFFNHVIAYFFNLRFI